MEAKVRFHVRQYLRECETRGACPGHITITSHLRETYAEYQRKPLTALRQVVAKVLQTTTTPLQYIETNTSDNNNCTTNSNDSKNSNTNNIGNSILSADAMKRARSDDEPLGQAAATIGAGNALNRAMQQTYAHAAADKKVVKKVKSGRHKIKKAVLHEDPPGSDAPESDVRFVVERPGARYSDMGGIQVILQEIRELIESIR